LDLNNGAVTTLMNPGSGPSQLWGITQGPTGDLYVSSRGNQAIYRVNASTGVPTLPTQSNLLYTPVGIDMVDADHLVVACLLTNRLVSVSLADHSQSVILQGGGLDQPWGVAIGGTDIYLAGYDRKDIQRVSAGGVLTTIATVTGFPYGLGVGPDGNPVVGLKGAGEEVVRLTPAGVILRSYTGSLIRQATGVEVARFAVFQPPTITTQPQNQTVTQGADALFSVTATGSPPFSYQWRFNATTLIPWGTNSTLTVTNAQDANAGNYSVVVDNGVAAASSNALLTLNHLPVPAAPTLERAASLGAKKRLANFLGTDPDGDPLILTSAGPTTTQGGTASLSGGWVSYTPPAGLATGDSFSFQLSDGRGGVSPGIASVIVPNDTRPTENLLAEPAGGQATRLRGDGVPGRTYGVEYCESLDAPNWQRLATLVADRSGAFDYLDTPPSGAPPRFYRALEP
jgi:hypothetical protein